MQDVHSFEYAIIRVVPKVEREEFFNVGVILYCATRKFLQVLVNMDEQKLNILSEETDIAALKEHLQAFEQIGKGAASGGPIARLDMPSRFRWLTATRSTIVQTSRVHPGMCADPVKTIRQLYQSQVL